MTTASDDTLRQHPQTTAALEGLDPGQAGDDHGGRDRRGWSIVALSLAAVLALIVGAIAGGFIGYNIGLADAADLEDQVTSLEAENAGLADAADNADAAAEAAQAQVDACQDAIQIAGQIVQNRDADLDFWMGPSSENLPEDPFDPVYDEATARDEEYRQLSGQLQVSASACLQGTATTSPAANG